MHSCTPTHLSLSLCLSTCLSGHKAGTCPRPLQRYTDMSMCPPFITVCFVSFMFCGRPLHIKPNSFWYFAIPALLCKLLFYLTKSIITSATKAGRVAGGRCMSRTTHALTTSNKSKLQNYKIAIRSEVLWVKYCSSYENRECTRTKKDNDSRGCYIPSLVSIKLKFAENRNENVVSI